MKKLIISIFVSCAAMCSLSAVADDYLPMLREGVQWVNRYIIREHAEPSHYGEQSFYSYEIKGDTTVNGVAYKKCHYYPGEVKDRSHDSIIALLREQDSAVYCFNNRCLIENAYPETEGKETVLYDFAHPENMKFYKNFVYPYDTLTIDSIIVGTRMLKRFKNGDNRYNIIEGIGCDSQWSGDLLIPVKPMITGVQAMSGGKNWGVDDVYLWYVKENGKIIYYGQTYSGSDGISQIKMDDAEAVDDAYYNLQGARVAADRLTPGIYIHNHKKVVVR